MKTGIQTALAIGALLFGGHASASLLTFTNPGDAGTINYGGNIDGTDYAGLSASTAFTLSEITGNSFVFDITIVNSTTSLWQDSRVSRIGFNVDPTVTGVSADAPWSASLGGAFPNNFGAIDICVQGQEKGACQGGPGGVSIGDSTSFSLALAFDNAPASVTLDNFGVRWQSLVSEEFGFSEDDEASGTGTPIARVPEPATLGLLGAGLIGLGAAARRRKA